MGLLDILAAGYLAKRANNKLNPPIIESPEDVTVIGVTAKGTNEYQIKFRKGNSSSWSSFRVTRNTRSRSGGLEVSLELINLFASQKLNKF